MISSRARTWTRRYAEINAFEEHLVDRRHDRREVLAAHLHASSSATRLLARLDDPTKRWKFNPGDIAERAYWADYQEAYADVLERCTTDRTRRGTSSPPTASGTGTRAIMNILVEQL